MSTKKRPVVKLIASMLVLCFLTGELNAAPLEIPARSSGVEALLRDPGLFQAPENSSTLTEIHPGTGNVFIIHIQDAHSNFSGQDSLASTLDALMTKYGVSLVLSEGGIGDCTLTPIKSIAKPEVWKRVARSYLMSGKLQGEEYLNLVSDHPMKIAGIEDPALYEASIDAYAALAEKREAVLADVATIEKALQKLKGKLYPESLKAYERIKQSGAFDASFDAFLKIARESSFELGSYPELDKLAALRDREKSVNFELANLEQAALVEELHQRGGTDDLDASLKRMDRIRGNRVALFAHFQNTLNIAKAKGIDVSEFKNLMEYTAYLEEFSKIDFDKLLPEYESAEDALYSAKLGEGDALRLRGIDRFARLLRTAHEIKLTPAQYAAFKAGEPDFGTEPMEGFLNRKLAENSYFDALVPAKPVLDEARTALDAFYASVAARDTAFLDNVGMILEKEGQKAAFLITGGYHTPHLKELFRKKGYGYAVLTPTVTAETNQRKYESLLLSKRSSAKKKVSLVEGQAASKDKPLAASDDLSALMRKKKDGVRAELAASNLESGAEMSHATLENLVADVQGSRMAWSDIKKRFGLRGLLSGYSGGAEAEKENAKKPESSIPAEKGTAVYDPASSARYRIVKNIRPVEDGVEELTAQIFRTDDPERAVNREIKIQIDHGQKVVFIDKFFPGLPSGAGLGQDLLDDLIGSYEGYTVLSIASPELQGAFLKMASKDYQPRTLLADTKARGEDPSFKGFLKSKFPAPGRAYWKVEWKASTLYGVVPTRKGPAGNVASLDRVPDVSGARMAWAELKQYFRRSPQTSGTKLAGGIIENYKDDGSLFEVTVPLPKRKRMQAKITEVRYGAERIYGANLFVDGKRVDSDENGWGMTGVGFRWSEKDKDGLKPGILRTLTTYVVKEEQNTGIGRATLNWLRQPALSKDMKFGNTSTVNPAVAHLILGMLEADGIVVRNLSDDARSTIPTETLKDLINTAKATGQALPYSVEITGTPRPASGARLSVLQNIYTKAMLSIPTLLHFIASMRQILHDVFASEHQGSENMYAALIGILGIHTAKVVAKAVPAKKAANPEEQPASGARMAEESVGNITVQWDRHVVFGSRENYQGVLLLKNPAEAALFAPFKESGYSAVVAQNDSGTESIYIKIYKDEEYVLALSLQRSKKDKAGAVLTVSELERTLSDADIKAIVDSIAAWLREREFQSLEAVWRGETTPSLDTMGFVAAAGREGMVRQLHSGVPSSLAQQQILEEELKKTLGSKEIVDVKLSRLLWKVDNGLEESLDQGKILKLDLSELTEILSDTARRHASLRSVQAVFYPIQRYVEQNYGAMAGRAIYEMLKNALAHGHGDDAGLPIYIQIKHDEKALTLDIHVIDMATRKTQGSSFIAGGGMGRGMIARVGEESRIEIIRDSKEIGNMDRLRARTALKELPQLYLGVSFQYLGDAALGIMKPGDIATVQAVKEHDGRPVLDVLVAGHGWKMFHFTAEELKAAGADVKIVFSKGARLSAPVQSRLKDILASGRAPLLALDLDDTFLPHGADMAPDALEALVAYIRHGGHVVFITRTRGESFNRRVISSLTEHLKAKNQTALLRQVSYIVQNDRSRDAYAFDEQSGNYRRLSIRVGSNKAASLQEYLQYAAERKIPVALLAFYGDWFVDAENDGSMIGAQDVPIVVNVGEDVQPSGASDQILVNSTAKGPRATLADLKTLARELERVSPLAGILESEIQTLNSRILTELITDQNLILDVEKGLKKDADQWVLREVRQSLDKAATVYSSGLELNAVPTIEKITTLLETLKALSLSQRPG